MAEGGKLLLKPGFLATHVRPDCERIRKEKVKRINRICKSLGVKGITPPSEQLLQQKHANENGMSWMTVTIYLQMMRMTMPMVAMQTPPSGQTAAQSQREPQSGATKVSGRVTRSTLHSDMDTQVLPPLVDQPQSVAVPSDNVGE